MSLADFELWHAVRPWTRRISLQIREVTSVSVTFILKSSMGASHSEALAVLGSESEDEDENSRRMPTISDVLGRGLSVKVNGSNWKRADVHVAEDGEEAVVIVYGLAPRKKYEISLGIAAADESIQETITTQSRQDELATAENLAAPNNELLTNLSISPSTLTPPTTPIRSSPPRTVTQDEQVVHLRKRLASLHTQHDELASQLKASRRESQRTETALKNEIEVLKRAAEKHASSEHRSRQKVLALQEAVKQASAAAHDIEEMVREVEAAMPGLNARAGEVEAEHNAVKEEAERRRTEMEDALQADKKMVADLQGELKGVCARLEKVTSKQEKLENEVPRLEETLQRLRREIAEIEGGVTSGTDDPQPGDEEFHGPWSARTWVSPIQRPSQPQRANVPATNSILSSSSLPRSRQDSFRSPRPSNAKRGTAIMPPPMQPYDPNYLSRALIVSEDAVDANHPQSRVTSELKPGSTFHTPPRFQTQSTSHASVSPYDIIIGRPPSSNGEREMPTRKPSLPTAEGYLNIESHENNRTLP